MKHLLLTFFKINLNKFDEEMVSSADTETVDDLLEAVGDNDQQEVSTEETDTPDIDSKFEELIKGEYKDAFDKRTHSIINKRFKESKELEAKHEELSGKFSKLERSLMSKYGTNDVDAAITKMEEESIEAEAYDRGMDIEDVIKEREEKAYVRKLETENKNLSMKNDSWDEAQRKQTAMAEWKRQEANLQQLYPDFSILGCAKNQEFVSFLQKGVQVQQAYELAFPDQYKARIEGAIVRDKQSNKRISENASEVTKTRNFTLKKSVSQMSDDDITKLAERAKKGETITFS